MGYLYYEESELLKVGDLIKHKEHGVGLLINIKEAPLEINERTHLYEIQWLKNKSGPTTYYAHTSYIWRDDVEVISASR